MSILTRIRGAVGGAVEGLRRGRDNSPLGMPYGASIQVLLESLSKAGEYVTPQTALESPTVYACVRLIASSLSHLEIQFLRTVGDGRTVDRNHRNWRLLNVACGPDLASIVFRDKIVAEAATLGNGYAFIHRDPMTKRAVGIEPMRPDLTYVQRDGNGDYFYHYHGGGLPPMMRPYDVFHLRGPVTYDGIMGVAPINVMRDLIGVEIVAEKYVGFFFRNMARPSGGLFTKGRLSPDARKRLEEDFKNRFAGAVNAGKLPIFEEGLEFKQMGLNSDDAQLVQLRKYCRQQIATAFGVPPHRVGDTDAQSYNSAEQADSTLVKYTLSTWAARLESEIMLKLFRPEEPYIARVSFDSLLRADIVARYGAYSTGIRSNVLLPNEAREIEGLPAVEGGSVMRWPLNTATSQQSGGEGADAPAQPKPAESAVQAIKPVIREAVRRSVDREGLMVLSHGDPETVRAHQCSRAELATDLTAACEGLGLGAARADELAERVCGAMDAQVRSKGREAVSYWDAVWIDRAAEELLGEAGGKR